MDFYPEGNKKRSVGTSLDVRIYGFFRKGKS